MVSTKLRNLFAGGAAVMALTLAAGSASAIQLFDPTDFFVVETPGKYEVVNTSSDWWIHSFSVSNSQATWGSQAGTTQPNWNAGVGSHCGDGPSPFPLCFFYGFKGGYTGDLTQMIAPGTSSDLFTFNLAPASTYYINIVNRDGLTGNLSGEARTDSAAPEPAAWALMISGFGLAGAALRRRRTAFG